MTSTAAAATTRGENLDDGLRSLGLSLSAAQRAALERYVALLVKWNRTYNLTAIRQPAQMITHHLLDSLAILTHLPEQSEIHLLDVGSGGGLPGIPLAIARPDWRVVMADASQKKAAFVTQAAIELSLPNARAVATRVEDISPDTRFDAIVSRAFADLDTFVSITRPLLRHGGRWYAMKGTLPQNEIDALPRDIDVVAAPALNVPGLNAERHLIIMQSREGLT